MRAKCFSEVPGQLGRRAFRTKAQLGERCPDFSRGVLYRLKGDDNVLYSSFCPSVRVNSMTIWYSAMKNLGSATPGGALVAFRVEDGKELWRWNSSQEIEVTQP